MLDSAGFYKRVCEAMGTESPVEIARKLGMTKHSAYAWSKGGMPGMNRLSAIARLSKLKSISIHYLLTGEGPSGIMPTPATGGGYDRAYALVPGLSPELTREVTLHARKRGREVTAVIAELILIGLAAENFKAEMAGIKQKRSSRRHEPRAKQAMGKQARKKTTGANSR